MLPEVSSRTNPSVRVTGEYITLQPLFVDLLDDIEFLSVRPLLKILAVRLLPLRP